MTSQLGIAGTSYDLQIGLINGKWASRLLKRREVIDTDVYRDDDIDEGLPKQDVIVGWVLRTVVIPNINPHQVKKTVQTLLLQAKNNKDRSNQDYN